MSLIVNIEAIRSPHGSVGLEVFQGRLRLRLPRKLFNGKQTYLSLGVDDTKLNRKIAEAKIRQIELDILNDNFDSTLARYKAQVHLAVVENLIPKQQIELSNLWLKHRDFK